MYWICHFMYFKKSFFFTGLLEKTSADWAANWTTDWTAGKAAGRTADRAADRALNGASGNVNIARDFGRKTDLNFWSVLIINKWRFFFFNFSILQFSSTWKDSSYSWNLTKIGKLLKQAQLWKQKKWKLLLMWWWLLRIFHF